MVGGSQYSLLSGCSLELLGGGTQTLCFLRALMTSVELKTVWLCPQDLPQETSKWNSLVEAVGGWFPLLLF